MDEKRVLVTGGAGFLGSHLCDRLLDEGHDVVCLDNFTTGSRKNIQHLFNHPRFSLVEGDVCLPVFCEVEEIYNLACPASPVHYQADPIKTTKTSVLGALNLLDLSLQSGAKIFQASTSEVYGDPHIHPQTEEYCGNVNPIGPRACYDEGKRVAETLFFDYHRSYGTSIRVGRIFNTYGPRMDQHDGRVVSNFIVQALLEKPLTIYGEGKQTRSFCFVDDLIRGIRACMKAPHTGPFNLGNPIEFTIIELARLVLDLTGSSSKIEFRPLPVDDPQQRKPNIHKAEQLLHWTPTIDLEQGLKMTIAYFSNLLGKPCSFELAVRV